MIIRVGDVYRHPFIVPFGDHVVLRLGDNNDTVLLARPYARASEYSRQPWLSAEVYELPVHHLDDWKLVQQGYVT